jgi:tetratricopeptide (TPR) repeat protein
MNTPSSHIYQPFIFFFLFFIIVVSQSFSQDNIDSLQQLAEKSEPSKQIELFNQIGKLNYRNGNYADALDDFSQSLEIAKQLNGSLHIAKMYSNIGVINDVIGNYTTALKNYQHSLKIYDTLNDKQGKESVLNNIGIIFEEMKMPDKALEYYFLALDLKMERGDLKSIAGTYNNIAIIYENFKKDSDSAYYYYNQALKIYKEIGNENDEALIYSNMGVILLRKGETTNAKTYFNKALTAFKKTKDPKNIATVLHYLGMAAFAESKYNVALQYYLQSAKLAENTNVRKLQSQIYNDLSSLYEQTGDFKKALEFNKKYEEIKDKLVNLEKVKQIHQLETNVEIEKREHEIDILKKQSELNELELKWTKTITYTLIAIFILTIIIIVLFFLKNKYKKEHELTALQTRLFRSQTSPHFIFNSLMSIQTFLLANKVDKASEYLVDFAKLIRSILQHTRQSFITLDKEIEVLQQYVKLEKLRFSDKFDYEFIINVDEPEDIRVPPMLTQPFIENAIIHGLVPSDKKGFLKLILEEKNDELIFIIEDNGIGRKQSLQHNKNKNHKSLATEITNQRLRLFLKRYKRKITMQTEDLYDEKNNSLGTRILFNISIN